MASELKKKILKREQAPPPESEPAQKGGTTDKGKESPREEGKKAGPHPKLERKSEGRSSQSEGGIPDEGGLPDTDPWWKRLLARKVVIFGIPALILVLGTGFLLFKFGSGMHFLKAPEQKLEPVTSVKRPVPIPDYREMADFIVLNETDRQKTMIALRMEFAFHSPAAYQNFKDQNVIFRDTVYSFLQRQNALRNTHTSWHTVVEKDLFEYLRVKLPQSKADQIRLTQVENL
jgi:flagellar basal body-associated protein FliL